MRVRVDCRYVSSYAILRNADCVELVECAKPIKELNNSAIVHHEPVYGAGLLGLVSEMLSRYRQCQ